MQGSWGRERNLEELPTDLNTSRTRNPDTSTANLIARLGDAGEFALVPEIGPLVMNIAAHAFLGRDFRRSLDDNDFFSCFRDFSRGMEMTWPLWLPLPHLLRSHRARRKLDRIFRAWIHRRRTQPPRPVGGTVTCWPARVRYAVRDAAQGQPVPAAAAVVPAGVATGGCPFSR
ncbi:MAG: hypothetical protein OXN97_14485 [Bryobacterales bacterium]|nr:hypothetical protein [Bryobacterales bacterium]